MERNLIRIRLILDWNWGSDGMEWNRTGIDWQWKMEFEWNWNDSGMEVDWNQNGIERNLIEMEMVFDQNQDYNEKGLDWNGIGME